jgi:hypothetical protein
MNRQDAKSAKETRYGAFEISFESSPTRSTFSLTWRSWRLGGENFFTLTAALALPNETALVSGGNWGWLWKIRVSQWFLRMKT